MSLSTSILSPTLPLAREAKPAPRVNAEPSDIVAALDTGSPHDNAIVRVARQLRDEWRKHRYERLTG